MSYKHIEIVLVERKPKTSVYSVLNIKFKTELGVIKWYPAWRKYCFFPKPDTVFDTSCLQDISTFILKLTILRKK